MSTKGGTMNNLSRYQNYFNYHGWVSIKILIWCIYICNKVKSTLVKNIFQLQMNICSFI